MWHQYFKSWDKRNFTYTTFLPIYLKILASLYYVYVKVDIILYKFSGKAQS